MGIFSKVELHSTLDGNFVTLRGFMRPTEHFFLAKSTAQHVADLTKGQAEEITKVIYRDRDTPKSFPRWAIKPLRKLLMVKLVDETIELESIRNSLQKKVGALDVALYHAQKNNKGLVEQQTKDLKSTLDNLHSAIIGKIGEYDKNLLSVGTEIKAMEKVFQKILPSLSDNVAELSKITTRLKGKK